MTETEGLNFRRFEQDDVAYDDLQEKIFQASWSHKCPTYIQKTPPCSGSCPSGHDIRGWLAIARGMDKPPVEGMSWQEYAFNRMVEANPFPAAMGRVCPAPCETGCNRNDVEDFVGINSLEHYVGDWAIQNNLKLPAPGADTGKKIAVIGGGPAGLSAAYFLRLQGHGVTLIEANEKLGGMMRYGIPEYRVPRDMLDAEIQRILDMGVEVRTGTKVGQDVTIEQLDKEFDSVFWGLGAQKGRPLPAEGWAGTDNCVDAVGFLKAFNEGRLKHVQGPVVCVGGGDTSIDVCCVARRLGTAEGAAPVEAVIAGEAEHEDVAAADKSAVDVVLTSLFPVDNMFATDREVRDALNEGVDIKGGVMPLEVVRDESGRATGLKMCECDMDGMKPIPREGTEFVIEGGLFVVAIGQLGNMDGLGEIDNGNGFVDADKVYQIKGRPGHFVGGDIIRPHLLTTAIGHGSIAAETITVYLQGEEIDKRPKIDVHNFNLLRELQQRDHAPSEYNHQPTRGTSAADFAVHNYEDRSQNEIIKSKDLFLGHFMKEDRNLREEIHISPDEVLGNFDSRLMALTEEQAINEGKRCMSCGLCFECDNCVIYCPQDAVHRVKKSDRTVGRYVDTDYTRCVGCHICMDVCPTGYIEMGLGE